MLFHFRLFGSRKPRKPMHTSHQARPQWIEPDAMDPNRSIPTVHNSRLESEFARMKRQERGRFRWQQLRRSLGEDVSRSMSEPLHLGGDHDAPTVADSIHRTDKIPNPEEE